MLIGREPFGDPVDDLDWNRCPLCGTLGESPKVALGFYRHDTGDPIRVVGEAQAGACSDLDHPPGQTGQQLVAVAGDAAFERYARACPNASEQRMTSASHRHHLPKRLSADLITPIRVGRIPARSPLLCGIPGHHSTVAAYGDQHPKQQQNQPRRAAAITPGESPPLSIGTAQEWLR
jgi:hypothetical protein